MSALNPHGFTWTCIAKDPWNKLNPGRQLRREVWRAAVSRLDAQRAIEVLATAYPVASAKAVEDMVSIIAESKLPEAKLFAALKAMAIWAEVPTFVVKDGQLQTPAETANRIVAAGLVHRTYKDAAKAWADDLLALGVNNAKWPVETESGIGVTGTEAKRTARVEQLLWPKKERTPTELVLYDLALGVLPMVYPYEQLTLAWMTNRPSEAVLLKHTSVKEERVAWWEYLQELKGRLWQDSLKYGKPELVAARNKLELLAKSLSIDGQKFEAIIMDRDTGKVETLSQGADRLLARMKAHTNKNFRNELVRKDWELQLKEVGVYKPEVNVPEATEPETADQPTGDTPSSDDSGKEKTGEPPSTDS